VFPAPILFGQRNNIFDFALWGFRNDHQFGRDGIADPVLLWLIFFGHDENLVGFGLYAQLSLVETCPGLSSNPSFNPVEKKDGI